MKIRHDDQKLCLQKFAFYFLIVAFSSLLVALVVSVFQGNNVGGGIFGAVDATLGFALRLVYRDLFPGSTPLNEPLTKESKPNTAPKLLKTSQQSRPGGKIGSQ